MSDKRMTLVVTVDPDDTEKGPATIKIRDGDPMTGVALTGEMAQWFLDGDAAVLITRQGAQGYTWEDLFELVDRVRRRPNN